ncbi:hypothetical protein GLOIN_2v1787184 [Rhizophagus irregularis DAOM 181602=DAOM 197198]|nr:hypothetical protein GLOIN_2v1787184 [Rhizophagus irregularis DAOM 181602=DAOM 197198]
MHVDFAEHTLSKEVEDALASIKKLKEISKETREWISLQCQFDLILSINGFLGMLTFFLNKYPNSMIQPKRISQDMLEGLFGTIRELGKDSFTQTLKSYRHSLNKYQVTRLVTSEVKSFNYGDADGTGTEQLSSLSHNVFESIFADNLIMGKIQIPSKSNNENIDQENHRIHQLQEERQNLIEAIFYQDSIDKLLQKWQDIIKKIAFDAISKKKKKFNATNLNNSPTQRLVAYLLLEKVIVFTFKRTSNSQLSINHYLISEEIIVLEPEEASKFSYIVGWIIYKLTKNDHITKLHPEFESICVHLKALNLE